MSHLPNELWLHILHFCTPHDSWRALRPLSHQLKSCVEQHFEREILPQLDISMPVALPSYDARIQTKGRATFQPVSPRSGRDAERLHLVLTSTDPDYYHAHFLARWSGMRNPVGGALSPNVKWDVGLGKRERRMRLRGARAENMMKEDEVGLSFEWKGTMTGFFKS